MGRGRQIGALVEVVAAEIEVDQEYAMLLEMSVLGILFTALTTGVPPHPQASRVGTTSRNESTL